MWTGRPLRADVFTYSFVSMGDKQLKICGCICLVAVAVASAIMIACSFGVLNNNDLGLDHDTIGQSLNTKKLYRSGRHFIGLGHKFIVFPAAQQQVH